MRTFAAALALSFLSACGTLGIPTAQTFNERVASGYSAVTAARKSATTLLIAKKISAADAQNVQSQADNARAALDIARNVYSTDPKAGEDKLLAAQAVLQALRSYLLAKEGG